MSLTQLSPLSLALGLAALAGGLYLLQRLRVRHEERVVVTTLFWREATEESRARTLVERFRHPLAYLMALAVAALLWLGVARPDSVRADGERHVLLLDASAAMAAPGRFDLAVDALEDELMRTPRDRTEVLWCGARVRTVLLPGDDRALLRARLDGLAPEPAPASVERAITARAASRDGADVAAPRRFVVVGDAPVREHVVALLGENDTIQRVAIDGAPATSSGITALGVAPAASGDWSRVDVLIDVRGDGAKVPSPFTSIEDGSPPRRGLSEGGLSQRTEIAAGHVRHMLYDVPAAGDLLTVRLSSTDDVPADDVATIRLPNRPPIRVAIAPTTGGDAAVAMRAALEADAAVELVPDVGAADIVVGDGSDSSRPSLALVPAADQEEAILLGHGSDIDSRAALFAAVGELGLDRLDASSLAEALGRPIAVGAAPANARSVSLWLELFDSERTTFVESRAFPLLVGRAVRWLADVEPIVPYAAAGRVLPRRVGEARASARLASFAPEDGVSLLDAATTLPLAGTGRAALGEPKAEGPGGWRPYTWLLLLALIALGAEWALFQRGRMP